MPVLIAISNPLDILTMNLDDFDVLTFDCYGTLIDWESGMIEALKPLTGRLDSSITRDQILQAHARHESAQQRWTPAMRYSELLSIVYKRIAEEWGLTASIDECETYGQSVKNWPAFSDSVASLKRLQKYAKLVILSNVDNSSFSTSNARLQVDFDAVITAEDVGSYKPDDRNFDYMIEQLQVMGIDKSRVLHTAESLFHDHQPATRHNLSRCWIYRRHDQQGFGATRDPGNLPEVDFQFNSMAEFADAFCSAR